MGQRKRRIERQAAAKAQAGSQATNREMSLLQVSKTEVMKMDISSTPSVGAAASYAAVTSGASAPTGTGWDWQAFRS
eukprot:5787888-Amphidinium_carterae.1